MIKEMVGGSFYSNTLTFGIVCSGKMARLSSSLSSTQSVSFRHGTNVEFNSPGFNPNNGPPSTGTIDGVAPIDAYNLQAINNKSRDFSNPMYDAVQSGSTETNAMDSGGGGVGNGSSGECIF